MRGSKQVVNMEQLLRKQAIIVIDDNMCFSSLYIFILFCLFFIFVLSTILFIHLFNTLLLSSKIKLLCRHLEQQRPNIFVFSKMDMQCYGKANLYYEEAEAFFILSTFAYPYMKQIYLKMKRFYCQDLFFNFYRNNGLQFMLFYQQLRFKQIYKSLRIGMFQDLSKKINLQNLQSIRSNHQKMRYPEDSDRPNNNDQQSENSDLEQMHIKLEQHELNIQKIEAIKDQPTDFLKRDNTIPPNMLRKLHNEIELLKQKIEIERNQNQRKIQYQKEISKRREEWLSVESSKLKHLVKKYKLESEQCRQAKKDVQNLTHIICSLQERIQNLQHENKILKLHLASAQKQLSKGKQKINPSEKQQCEHSERIQKMCKRIEQLEDNLICQKRFSQQKKKKLEKALNDLEGMRVSLDGKQMQYEQKLLKKQEEIKKREDILNMEISSLKKRNHHLEQTFIQKMSQITQLQANILTNNSSFYKMNPKMTQSMRKQRNSEQTLNIQNQSPIKPVPHANTTSPKRPNNPDKPLAQNPQIYQTANNPSAICTCCQKRVQKYKNKLEQANRKIIDLLQQKATAKNYKNKTFVSTAWKYTNNDARQLNNVMGCEQGRTKIMSWKQFLA